MARQIIAVIDGVHEAITCVGTTLVGSPELTGSTNTLTTSAGQVACRLPVNLPPGPGIVVYNATATSAEIFPPTADGQIFGGLASRAAGASIQLAQYKSMRFILMQDHDGILLGQRFMVI